MPRAKCLYTVEDALAFDKNGDPQVDWRVFSKMPCSFNADRNTPKRDVVEQLLEYGILSHESEGNWEILIVGAHMPYFQGEMVFFVNPEDAMALARVKKETALHLDIEIRQIVKSQKITLF